MSIAIAGASEHQAGGIIPSAQTTTSKKPYPLIETLKSDKTKRALNYVFNGGSTALSLFTFLNGNFNFINSIQEKLEKASEIFARTAFAKVSMIGAIDLWQKKNPLALLGYALSVPTAILSNGYNLWLASGITNGLCNFIVITDQREIVDKNGDPIPDENGNVQYVNGDFSNRGWEKAITTTFSESFKMIKEVVKKPEKIKKISHSVLISSIIEIFGPLVSFAGFEKAGSFLRNASNVAIEAGLLLHKDSNDKSPSNNHSKINLKSPIAQSGILWMTTSIIDFLKRYDFVSERVNNLTYLSLGFDRAASILFTNGIFNVKKTNNG